MVDSLTITSSTPTAVLPPSTRGVPTLGDGECSKFAQVMHDARGSSGTGKVQAAAPSDAGSTDTLPTDTAQKGGGAARESLSASQQSSTANDLSLHDVADPAAALATAAIDQSASADNTTSPKSTSAVALASNIIGIANPTQTQWVPPPDALETPVEGRMAFTASNDHAGKAHASKRKEHSTAGDGGASVPAPTLPPPREIGPVAVAATLAKPPAPPASGNGKFPGVMTAIRAGAYHAGAALNASSANPSPVKPSADATDISASSMQVILPSANQQSGDVLTSASAASSLQQQSLLPASSTDGIAVGPRPSSLGIAGMGKGFLSAHAVKNSASPGGTGDADASHASAGSAPTDKVAQALIAPSVAESPFVSTLSRHVAATTADAPPAVQQLSTHATFHPLQSSAAIGRDPQANGLTSQVAADTSSRSAALEVGFHDANLGWLSVRASTDAAGSLHAAVGAKTPAAVASVGTMLPALERFLQQENVVVHSVSTAATAGAAAVTSFPSSSLANASLDGAAFAGHQQQGNSRNPSQRNGDRSAGKDVLQNGAAPLRFDPGTTDVRYGGADRTSTVSVRI